MNMKRTLLSLCVLAAALAVLPGCASMKSTKEKPIVLRPVIPPLTPAENHISFNGPPGVPGFGAHGD